VVLDPGNLVISVTLPLPGLTGISRAYDDLTDWLIAGLEEVGVSGVKRAGTSDLALDDRKVGGSCIYRIPGLLYYTTTLLITPDLDLVERWLRHPPREPDYRRGRPHREFMTGLGETAAIDEIDLFGERFTRSLAALNPMRPD
jgi:lipoate-protein ligase A